MKLKTSQFSGMYEILHAQKYAVPVVTALEDGQGISHISWEKAVSDKLVESMVVSMAQNLHTPTIKHIEFCIIGKIFKQSKPFRVNRLVLHPEGYAIAYVTGQKSDRIIEKWEKKLTILSGGLPVGLSWDMVVHLSSKLLAGDGQDSLRNLGG